ncbi:Major Facilitator Superfamily protein [Paraburkholderia fungorum]|uniref:Major Facilitator Superfamily protein n=1 Tax=Paraburkholderia fungorum TaxID=134537 RepID=A0A1H1HDK6_9BURK|nr:MFS transporter [Paraburkholderia fungorum]SDR23106.1 Major Facilitator Superfamily protein [Paraburkholderia fungorum]
MQDRPDPADNAAQTAHARRAVLVIALAQLLGTSLWFSANGAMRDLQAVWQLNATGIGWLTNAVQAGFIVGTLISATTGLADRMSASKVFAVCGVAGALLNALFALCSSGLASAIVFRFGVGVALAGIYPLGMKLLVTWDPRRAAQTLALLVAMLTLGTASVHAIRALFPGVRWQAVVLASSGLAVIGAALVLALGEGPHARRSGKRRAGLSAGIGEVLRISEFRAAALGYFGHMWELYAFWTLTPLLVQRAFAHDVSAPASASTVAMWSFLIIAVGAAGCVLGGKLSQSVGSARTAALALTVSGFLCAVYPLSSSLGTAGQLALLLVWGISVIADSPQFSALSVKACPADRIGGALTLQNSFGFFLSACSILWSTSAYHSLDARVAWLLLPGPVIGLIAMTPLLRKRPRW